jgi:tetratricopeptide (TPR) repeat protein
MTSLRRRLLVTLALTLLTASLGAVELPPERERWITLRADEFQIFSNASEGTTSALAKQLVTMRDAVGQVTQLKVRSPLPTRVYIFRDDRNFAPWRDAAMQRPSPTTTGLFTSSDSGNMILIRGDAPGGVDRVVFHELTHYFVRNTVASLPLWANEGLAEYYSTFAASGNDVQVGKPVPEHVLWLRDQALIPLRELFATDETSPNYNEGTRAGVFYAESWALIHYLMLGNPQRHEQLGRFLNLLEAQRPLDDAFRTAFGAMTYEELERELRAYVRQLTFRYTRYRGAELHPAELPKPVPMARGEVLYELGHLLAWSGTAAGANGERFLDAALAADPSQAGAWADLGRLQAQSGRRDEAAKSFERATALGSGDAEVYLDYGDTLLARLFERQGSKIDRDALAKTRALFVKSTTLDPASSRAWAGLGATYVLGQDPAPEGIAALEKSLALAPAQQDVAFNLVQMYAHAGRGEEAARLVDNVIAPASDARRTAEARQTLLQSDLQRMAELLRAGRQAEALALAKTLLPRTTDPELHARLEQLLAGGGPSPTGVPQPRVGNQLAEAVRLADAGKYAEAIALVDEALPTLTDPATLAYARRYRSELVEAAAKAKTKKKKP